MGRVGASSSGKVGVWRLRRFCIPIFRYSTAPRISLTARRRVKAPVVGLAPTRTGLKGRTLDSLHSRALNMKRKWRNVVDMLHKRGNRRLDLFSKESRLACPVHVPKNEWCPRQDLHPHFPASETGASAVGLRGRR